MMDAWQVSDLNARSGRRECTEVLCRSRRAAARRALGRQMLRTGCTQGGSTYGLALVAFESRDQAEVVFRKFQHRRLEGDQRLQIFPFPHTPRCA